LYRDRPWVFIGMVLANILVSAWCIYRDPVINNDAITYLAISEQFVAGQWDQIFDYYSWPFYSIFVAITAKILFLDVETAAYVLNTLFATLMTLAFVSIVSELSNNNKKIILIAAVIIILFPSINKYRPFIIRDFGYLCFYLWSLFFIFRFSTTLNKKHLIGWLACASISCLFRFEGIVFLLIAPYFLLLFVAKKIPNRRAILTSLSLVIILACLSLLIWYINDKYNAMIEMAKLTGQDIDGVTDLFFLNIDHRLKGEALTALSFFGVVMSNIGDVFYELFRRMAIFYLIFAIYAYVTHIAFKVPLTRRIWLVYVIANLIVLIGFSMYNNFLVSRYTMATALTLLILAPFTINRIFDSFTHATAIKKFGISLIFILLAGISLDRLNMDTTKNHIKQAGVWLTENTAEDAKVFSNNKLLIYYADQGIQADLSSMYGFYPMIKRMVNNKIRYYDYIALVMKDTNMEHHHARQTLTYMFGQPIKIFRQDNSDDLTMLFKHTRPIPIPPPG